MTYFEATNAPNSILVGALPHTRGGAYNAP